MTQEVSEAAEETLLEGKQRLTRLLQTAFELELGTLPPYLMAVLSIKPTHNKAAANIIHQIAMEEMLHLLLVGNMMASIGAKIELSEKNLPTYPLKLTFDGKPFKDRRFDVNLSKFSKTTLDTFTQIELPQDWQPKVELFVADFLLVPAYTVGEFYSLIGNTLIDLCDRFGPKAVFTSGSSTQVNEAYYWWGRGKPIVVTDLQSALEALGLIVQQGEGVTVAKYKASVTPFAQRDYMAHFFRFKEIYHGRYYADNDDPELPPTGEPLEVDYDAVFPIIDNPKSNDYAADSQLAKMNVEFNRRYTQMLIQIVEAFNGTPKAMYTAIMNGMHGLMPIAAKMVSTPIENDPQGRTGAPSFQWVDPFF